MTGPTGPLRATVTAVPAMGSRSLRVRFDGDTTAEAPAFLPTGTTGTVVLGQRVLVDMIGRRPVVRVGS